MSGNLQCEKGTEVKVLWEKPWSWVHAAGKMSCVIPWSLAFLRALGGWGGLRKSGFPSGWPSTALNRGIVGTPELFKTRGLAVCN